MDKQNGKTEPKEVIGKLRWINLLTYLLTR